MNSGLGSKLEILKLEILKKNRNFQFFKLICIYMDNGTKKIFEGVYSVKLFAEQGYDFFAVV